MGTGHHTHIDVRCGTDAYVDQSGMDGVRLSTCLKKTLHRQTSEYDCILDILLAGSLGAWLPRPLRWSFCASRPLPPCRPAGLCVRMSCSARTPGAHTPRRWGIRVQRRAVGPAGEGKAGGAAALLGQVYWARGALGPWALPPVFPCTPSCLPTPPSCLPALPPAFPCTRCSRAGNSKTSPCSNILPRESQPPHGR